MRKLLSHPFILILACIVVALLLISLQLKKSQVARRAQIVASQEESLQQLRSDVAGLESQLEASSDPFYQEKVLRNELLMQKEGEIVVQIPSEQLPIRPQPTPTPTNTPWQAWQQTLNFR